MDARAAFVARHAVPITQFDERATGGIRVQQPPDEHKEIGQAALIQGRPDCRPTITFADCFIVTDMWMYN
jgi:hypothetical protein